MTTITTPRLSLTRFVTDDWPFFLRLRQDPQVMRFMGEVLSEEALRSVFVSRCADPGVFVLRDKFGEALGDIGLRISPKNPHEADVGYALEKAYHLNGIDYDDWIYRLEREAHPASADAG